MVLSVSIGISPRETLASWADLAAELKADGVDQLWLIDCQLATKDVYAGLLLAGGPGREAGAESGEACFPPEK